MKLRNYSQFINENVEITDDLLEVLMKRGKFWDEIFELDYSKFDFTRSYSDMCKRINRNPEQDFQKIQKHFDEKGFTLEEIKDLFSEENNQRCGYNLEEFYKGENYPINREPLKSIVEGLKKKYEYEIKRSQILQPFSIGSKLDSLGAIQDFYLYKLFEKLGLNPNVIRLGGSNWGEIDEWENDDNYSEAFIRYKYGYHQTEYGKLWMKQCQIDEEWLREESIGQLQKYIEEEFQSVCGNILRSLVFISRGKSGTTASIMQLRLEDFSIVEEDRIIINIHKLCLEILNLCGIQELTESDIEIAAAEFTKRLDGFSLDIELTDSNELIIWGRFKEN